MACSSRHLRRQAAIASEARSVQAERRKVVSKGQQTLQASRRLDGSSLPSAQLGGALGVAGHLPVYSEEGSSSHGSDDSLNLLTVLPSTSAGIPIPEGLSLALVVQSAGFSPQELSNMMWALSRLKGFGSRSGSSLRSWLSACDEVAMALMPLASAQNASNLLLVATRQLSLRLPNERMVQAAEQRLVWLLKNQVRIWLTICPSILYGILVMRFLSRACFTT